MFVIPAAAVLCSLSGCDIDTIEAIVDGTGAADKHPWLANILTLLKLIPLALVAGAIVIYVARRALLRERGQTATAQAARGSSGA